MKKIVVYNDDVVELVIESPEEEVEEIVNLLKKRQSYRKKTEEEILREIAIVGIFKEMDYEMRACREYEKINDVKVVDNKLIDTILKYVKYSNHLEKYIRLTGNTSEDFNDMFLELAEKVFCGTEACALLNFKKKRENKIRCTCVL